jgi:uncharacterized membrane protein
MARDVRPVRPGRRVIVKRKTGMEWLPVAVVIALIVIAGIVAWVLITNNDTTASSAVESPVALVTSMFTP